MAPSIAALRVDLEAALLPTYLEIEDQSSQHVGHAGAQSGGGHYRVLIVSPQFAGKSRLARHRLVYDALQKFLPDGIHALALTAFSADEWTQ